MFKKILIANRGEIAVRIARACRALGVVPVGVYSDADRFAMHVRACDESYRIGPAPAAESYLCGDRIIEVARQAGCEAIHPGYGFLSENAAFARSVIGAGLVWIGPPPEAIELMGSKIESKRLAEQLGVPVVPGYLGDDQSTESLVNKAEEIGFPVLVKASAGGGGKGMRVVTERGDMEASIAAAQREAQAAFGDPSLLLEKYLEHPRHIEVQVLGDNHGTLVHLGERECTIQRRHQKVLEESPSPVVNEDLRDRLTGSALTLARAAGYANAGTVEFIYQDGEFYFLEMNTRLQVEHPVTELALGIDLVQAQIRIAAGEKLWFSQGDVRFKAHAVEARLYAEDPEHDFLPSTGRLSEVMFSDEARIDAGVQKGDSITPYYDPMIAKIITGGPTREAGLRDMRTVLGGTKIEGVKTNLDFLRWLVAQPDFVRGEFSTKFIEDRYSPGALPEVPLEVVVAAGAVLALDPMSDTSEAPPADPWHSRAWRHSRQGMEGRPVVNGRTFVVTLSALAGQRGRWHLTIREGDNRLFDGPASISIHEAGPSNNAGDIVPIVQLQLDGSGAISRVEYRQTGTGTELEVRWGDEVYSVRPARPLSTERMDTRLHLRDEDTLESPMPGKVLKVLVQPGDEVTAEQPLVIVEAMKMEFTVRAPHDGQVSSIKYAEGAQVAVGDVLVELTKQHGR